MLWDLSTDYYLHHADPRTWSEQKRNSYIDWFSPQNLQRPEFNFTTQPQGPITGKPLSFFDEYWLEYYKPQSMTSFKKMLPIKMNSTYRYVPFKTAKEGRYDLSPFRVRDKNEHCEPEKEQEKKETNTVSPEKEILDEHFVQNPRNAVQSKRSTIQEMAFQHDGQSASQHSILKDASFGRKETPPPTTKQWNQKTTKEKSAVAQWTLDQFFTHSLNPSVSDTEAYEYQRYINHPLTLPLVVSDDLPPKPSLEFLNYVHSTSIDVITSTVTSEDDLAAFTEFLSVPEDPLTVTKADVVKKRYKAYRQWMKGKSLFKQRVEA